ncbi:hypothetical protein [Nitratireductor thuwali]|uniref:SH3 domain-containing protein n=1 Tax=Nitratireductor thuwali TaxID=2267699 RepID=A0ABY5MJM6_9HYPH|nr:hypothetical protein NTH_02675 [Nitratireductor thuwali]
MPKSTRRRTVLGAVAAAACYAVFLAPGNDARAEADGPDSWRVVDVAPNDALNARMGPGTDYAVIGQFAHNARALQQVTCVPLVPPGLYFEMSEAERAALPPRWCLMQNADRSIQGWVAQRYLAEDGGPVRTSSEDGTQDIVQAAERLVKRLYSDHIQAMAGGTTSPLHPSRASDFFAKPLAAKIAQSGLQADPLFDSQDAEITDLRIALDGERPMFRGLITVNADFRNFGHPRRAVVRLRVFEGMPRIIRIEHEEWVFQ